MSSAINQALVARLTGVEILTGSALLTQQQLVGTGGPPLAGGLLALSPDDGMPAVYQGNLDDTMVFPCITFRPDAGLIDRRFGDGTMAIDWPVYSIEIWTKSQVRTTASQIEECLFRLLDSRIGAPVLPLSSGRCRDCVTFVQAINIYDDRIKGWATLLRYRFVEERFPF